MALCLADSLLTQGGFDPVDQLERYVRWRREGYLSSTGRCFDIGNTVSEALRTFEETGNPRSGPTHPRRAGNGSIMRLAPVVLAYHPDRDAVDRHAAASSVTTHGAAEAIACCRILGGIVDAVLSGWGKAEALASEEAADWMSPRLRQIASSEYRHKEAEEVRGSGYAVDCLEAALWSFERTESFESAILLAANLGDDADTTAAVCGQVAGAYYGASGIPVQWREKLALGDVIEAWASRLLSAAF
jgi:ADP-ribosyl-[dinitrogen reductase] hydrolase